ncbi:MAG TPA: hypothetical protein VF665_06135 [Longimicrobium sp.]|jgi:hypothetical protein|uniref:hypothetical protein n=1 Tax=Longimicrobium sp. TaxID=2029185 RepID=UPI002EDAD584
MQLETIVVAGSTLGALMSLSAAVSARIRRAAPRDAAEVSITIEDAAGERTTTVIRTRKPVGEVRRIFLRAMLEA